MRSTSLTFMTVLAAFLATGGVHGQDLRREAGAHVHGAGKLGIVIDGNTVSFDLDTPANDILGFEHPPKTTKEKAALQRAVAAFKDAGKVFGLSAAAGCRVTKAEAGLEEPEGAGSKEKSAEGQEVHADFNSTVVFECRDVQKLKAIDFRYFTVFPYAQKLSVTLITQKGQASFEVTRSAPRLDLPTL